MGTHLERARQVAHGKYMLFMKIPERENFGGAKRNRSDDLFNAILRTKRNT